MRRPHKNNTMKTWLKCIGSAKKPITRECSVEQVGFRKLKRPSIRAGDILFFYAPGHRRIFALAEAVGDPEHDADYNGKEGSCFWKLPVSCSINMPVDAGIQLGDIKCSRDLRLSVRQASHLELRADESQEADRMLQQAYKKFQERQSA